MDECACIVCVIGRGGVCERSLARLGAAYDKVSEATRETIEAERASRESVRPIVDLDASGLAAVRDLKVPR